MATFIQIFVIIVDMSFIDLSSQLQIVAQNININTIKYFNVKYNHKIKAN